MRYTNVPLGAYVDTGSVIHRLGAGWKLAALFVFVVATSLLIHTTWVAAALIPAVAIGYFIGAIPWRTALGQLSPPLVLLVPLAGFQWWQRGLAEATVMFFTVYAALMAAILVTLTTTVAEMMDALEGGLAPLARFGVPVELISLAMSLTIRLIPLMLHTVSEVLDARKARGAGASLAAFGTPVIIRSIRRARAIGEALAARGVGD